MSYHLEPVESVDTIAAAFKPAPGTELLYDQDGEYGAQSRYLHTLQHVRKGDSHILLVPQPSLADPNDPLKWSATKKWLCFANGLAYAFLGAVTGPIMAAGMIGLSVRFGESLQRLTYANGATLVCQGVFNIFWMPFAVKYGRRPVYLLSTFLTGIACIWLGVASTKSYNLLLIARAFLGAWEAPIESIVPSTVTDIFFLHDRGEKIAMYGLSVLGGNELGPTLSAFIIQALGMNWAFYIVGIFIFANFVTMFFFMPETRYIGKRSQILPTRPMTEELKSGHVEEVEEIYTKKSHVHGLIPWGTSDPNVNIFKVFLRPFVLFTYPTVLWGCLIYGLALSWNVILGATTAQLFAPPPYSFNSSSQGLVFLSPLIGSLVGTYLCGPLADTVANYFTRRNHGIREPEMRLPMCAVAAVLTFLGALMAGLCLKYQTHWAGPVVGFGVLSAGGQMGATLGMNYALDCHKELSVELMVSIATLKSLIAWIWTWVINDWLARDGPLVTFCTIAAVNIVAYLTTFILYRKGKAIRVWLQETDLLGRLGLGEIS